MRILTVCLGNICRSPMAEGIIRQRFEEQSLSLEIDSCGTAAYHVGERADPRSISTAHAHGIDIGMHRARKFSREDFGQYDLILTMDEDNFHDVLSLARNDQERSKVMMIMDILHPGMNVDVPDPYYGGKDGFERVFRMLDDAAIELVKKVKDGKHGSH